MAISAAIAGAAQGAALSRHLLPRHHATAPVDSITTIVRRDTSRIALPRPIALRRRRARRRSSTDDGGEDAFSGDDGPFGGGGHPGSGGGGGRWWGPDWSGDSDGWGEEDGSRWRLSPDPAFGVVCEMLSWVALSNCATFAFKRIWRIVADREKPVAARLVPSIC